MDSSSSESPYEIPLEEMQVEFEIDGRKVSTPAKAVLKLLPSLGIVFKVWDVPRNPEWSDEIAPGQPVFTTSKGSTPMLSEGPTSLRLKNGTTVDVVPSSWIFTQDEGTLCTARLPYVVLDTGTPLEVMRFSVMNFSRRALYPLPYLEAPPWQVTIDPVSGLDTLRRTLDTDRGFAITHHGTIARTDNSQFSVQEATELLDALNAFLSFVCGTFCSPLNAIGLDRNGDEAWKRWGPQNVSPWSRPRSWFDLTISHALSDIFEGFLQEYRNDPQGQGSAARWYAYSNETDVVDVSMIFTQTALESLTHSTVGAKPARTRTGEWIADALQHVGIDLQIPSFCSELQKLANQKSWKHGPHALVEIRNDIVHSNAKHTNIPIDAYHEAQQLGLWYLELMLLQRFGYMGEYANRLTTVQRAGATEAVPWK